MHVYVVCLYLYDAFTRGEHACMYTHVCVRTHKGVYTRDLLRGIGSSLKAYSLQAGGPGKPKVQGPAPKPAGPGRSKGHCFTRSWKAGKDRVSFVGSLSLVSSRLDEAPHQRGPRA